MESRCKCTAHKHRQSGCWKSCVGGGRLHWKVCTEPVTSPDLNWILVAEHASRQARL